VCTYWKKVIFTYNLCGWERSKVWWPVATGSKYLLYV